MCFRKEILHEKDQIDDGIGLPDWKLTLCLAATWFLIFLVVIRGVKSSGKVAYFLALFPYVVLICLLVRGCSLPGALDGIIFFITPEWSELLNPKVGHFNILTKYSIRIRQIHFHILQTFLGHFIIFEHKDIIIIKSIINLWEFIFFIFT